MRIIEAISDTNIGGAGVLLVNRLKNSDRKKYQTTVVLPKGSQLIERLADAGTDIVEIDMKGDKSFDVKAIYKLYKAMKKIDAELINTHGFLSARIAAFFAGIPSRICTRHCYFKVSKIYSFYPVKAISYLFNKILTNRFIAVSDTAAENLLSLGIDKKSIKVIINGSREIDKTDKEKTEALKKTLGISSASFVFGMFARVEEYKGQDTFLRAADAILKKGIDAHFLIVGDGNDMERIKRLASELGISDKVTFTGFIDKVDPYMNIIDVNVNCSRGTETSSLSLSEGMSLGKPIIASDYGGNPHMVKNGINGYVFKTDDAGELSLIAQKLYLDKNIYEKLSRGARERFENEFKIQAMTEKTYRFYESVRSVCSV